MEYILMEYIVYMYLVIHVYKNQIIFEIQCRPPVHSVARKGTYIPRKLLWTDMNLYTRILFGKINLNFTLLFETNFQEQFLLNYKLDISFKKMKFLSSWKLKWNTITSN